MLGDEPCLRELSFEFRQKLLREPVGHIYTESADSCVDPCLNDTKEIFANLRKHQIQRGSTGIGIACAVVAY